MSAQAPLSALCRGSILTTLRGNLFDILVIGGGINGAGIAREAAGRGLKVALVEAQDFAYGTSSRSSKLIHGGLRYLAQGEIGLVREAARERQVLRRIAPHLAEPTKMLVPAYGRTRASLAKLMAGMWMFELLAPVPPEESYRVLGADEARAAEPHLRKDGLCGAITYYEFTTDDARLVLDTLKSACDAGLVALNYARAVAISPSDAGPIRVRVRDTGGTELEVSARSVVNAAGPWLDSVAALAGPAPRKLHLTKGIHLVFRWADLPINHCVIMQGRDRRPVFAVPRGDTVYLGTTDTDYCGPIDEPPVDELDVEYLLDAARRLLPAAGPSAHQAIASWAGLRPLLHQEGKKPSEISRRDEVIVSPGGLVSVAGGKLTTYRAMAERVVRRVMALPQMESKREAAATTSSTDRLPLSGGDLGGAAGLAAYLEEVSAARPLALASPEVRRRLVCAFGANALAVAACAEGDASQLLPLAPGVPVTSAEVRYGVRHEMACTVCDILERRSRASLFAPENGLAAVAGVAREMGRELGWTEDQINGEVAAYRERVKRMRAACCQPWGETRAARA